MTERELLRGRRAGFTNVVARDRHAVPPANVVHLVLDRVDDELHRGFGRVDELVLRVEFLEDVVLQRATEAGGIHVALPGHRIIAYQHIVSCLMTGRYDKALETAGHWRDKQPNDQDWVALEADAFERRGKDKILVIANRQKVPTLDITM